MPVSAAVTIAANANGTIVSHAASAQYQLGSGSVSTWLEVVPIRHHQRAQL